MDTIGSPFSLRMITPIQALVCALVIILGQCSTAKPVATASTHLCSRQLSREAMHIIHQKVFLPAQAMHFHVPDECPFVADHILHLEHEQRKERTHSGRYRCGFCKKQFRNEEYLDGHFDRKHTPVSSSLPTGLCMADYCDILNCPTYISQARHAKCTHSSARRLKQKCQALFQACFPYQEPSFDATTLRRGEPEANQLYESMLVSICDTISCDAPDTVDPPSLFSIVAVALLKFVCLMGVLMGLIYAFDRYNLYDHILYYLFV
ncbi:hypothetical protein, variant 1 [Aphanomyces astaci]|uniref:C2H2-type domain-containing protein n=1 Tax=Aphanomyces astaci TaxID=112090 RepID=W4HCE0_APHAT|nr:hypothetical protein, variant 1 [Aphanomyces astaci]ETV89567.1 hypothetical protein, variant 1 [Aphanomyces astaci]|eukprot:XP_009821967.1 hypothetical protein, variant 1 [Aphanomyces astaci]